VKVPLFVVLHVITVDVSNARFFTLMLKHVAKPVQLWTKLMQHLYKLNT